MSLIHATTDIKTAVLQLLMCCPPHGCYEWLSIINVIMGVQEAFGVELPPEEVRNFIREHYHPTHLRKYPTIYGTQKISRKGKTYPGSFYVPPEKM
ncbi:hypothetical protein XU18_3267 [Perkinsela sp. CCAP 1560/4]|nr:hypothetical protein XU18_3267 [Perkinsela sp. CCAP 1560/4]|eukprot:KNH05745.1 hypothetical protein XU18_3267 [Perkinsela sp. CCAP 1560/4]